MLDENLKNYLLSMQNKIPESIRDVYNEAKNLEIPIIRDDTIAVLSMILKIHKPKKILELGTGSGFSSLFFSTCLKHDVEIITIDRYEKMLDLAKANFEKKKANNIKLIKADINDYIPKIQDSESFDFIFLDSAKSQYYGLLNYCIKLLKDGGVLIADDVLQDGKVVLKKEEIERRQRTIHTNLNLFLHEINSNSRLESTILAVGDGLSISRKIEKKDRYEK